MLNKIVSYFIDQEDKLLKSIRKTAMIRNPSFANASEIDRTNMEKTMQAMLKISFKMLKHEKVDNASFDQTLIDLAERRVRQEIPLIDVVDMFQIVREKMFKYLQQLIKEDETIPAKTILDFEMILNKLSNRIGMGIVKPYLQYKDNIIQAQQSFLKHKFSSLFKVVESVSNNLNIQEACEHLIDYICKFYDVKIAGVFLLEEKEKELYPQHVSGLSKRFKHEQRLAASTGIIKKCLSTGNAEAIADHPYNQKDITVSYTSYMSDRVTSKGELKRTKRTPDDSASYPELASLYAPMIGRQRTYGVLSIHSLKERSYTSTEIQQLETLSRILTVSLENAGFYQNLIEEKGKLDAIVHSVNEGLILIDYREEIVFINEQAARYFQLPAYRLMGHSASIIQERLLNYTKDSFSLQASYLRALTSIMDHPVLEFTLMKPELTDVKLTMFPVRDREHHFIGRGMVLENISHENEVNRMKSEFVALASHTMRTPMTSILGFASLLVEKDLPKTMQQKYMINIFKEANRLTGILNDMLDLANIEAGKLALNLNPTDMTALLSQSAKTIEVEMRKKIIREDSKKKMPIILADSKKIEQALLHILANAIKYCDNDVKLAIKKVQTIKFKKNWIHSKVEGDEVPGLFPAIQINVEDDGPGIVQDQLDAIFEPFYRLPVEKRFVQEGSGLGLTIARYTIEAHGGKIWVETKENKGSIFSILLPVELSRPEKQIGRFER